MTTPIFSRDERRAILAEMRCLARRFLDQADDAHRTGDAQWSNALEHASDEVLDLVKRLEEK
jgi:hypothetical protein